MIKDFSISFDVKMKINKEALKLIDDLIKQKYKFKNCKYIDLRWYEGVEKQCEKNLKENI